MPVKDFVTKVIESGILDKKTTGLVGINPDFINQNDRTTTVNIDYPEENGCTLSFVTMNNSLFGISSTETIFDSSL